MKFKIILVGALFSAVALFYGCDKLDFSKMNKGALQKNISQAMAPKREVKGPLVAKVNNMPISLEDLDQSVSAYNRVMPADKPEAKITSREQKINYLKNELVQRLLLYQDALDRGLDRDPDIINALEKTKEELLVVKLIGDIAKDTEVSNKEIEDYYNTFKDQLKEPEQRQIREIVVSSEQEAKDILIQLLQGADFATLAKDRSKAASAKNGGDLGFISRDSKPAQFDAVAFSDSLDVGRISSVFRGPDGYYIIKLEAKRGGQQKTLSELWDDIKKALTFIKQQQKIDDLVGKLSREAKIEIYEGQIK